ncbi:MAG: dolichyl-phosphate beta-glucosyltransferase [Dehalococcoidia bacterium]
MTANVDADTPHLTFVVPAYNEERRLVASLQRLIGFAAAEPCAVEIIVVDDGSADRTAEIAREAASGMPANVSLRLLQHERNRGKGAAVRTGALAARGDYVLSFDADLAMPPEEASKLLAALEAGAGVAAGTRVRPEGGDMRASQPAWRRIGGRLFGMVRRRLLLSDIQDTQCGFKAFRRDVAQAVFSRQQLDGWAFDPEVLYIARKLGYEIAQVPIAWEHQADSQFRLGARAALREIRDLLRIRRMHRGLTPLPKAGPKTT